MSDGKTGRYHHRHATRRVEPLCKIASGHIYRNMKDGKGQRRLSELVT